MKASELLTAVEGIFACVDGEPRAWTRNPPFLPLATRDDEVPGDQKYWYQVFGFSSDSGTEEQLVDALWKELQWMRSLCLDPKPTLIWRRKPEYSEERINRKHIRKISIRIVIPELTKGPGVWIRTPAYKPDNEPSLPSLPVSQEHES
jgi:hypothetical protein